MIRMIWSENIMQYQGITALMTLVSHFAFILLAFRGFQALRFDRYVNQEKQDQFKVVLVLVSVAIGFLCSSFFLSVIENIKNLGYLIK